jgi:sugar lactone lactonase YvrE
MTIDHQGMLWIALWGGGAVSRWNPLTGELLEKYGLPVQNVSSCCFGGKDMDLLFITTASQDTDMEKYPLAGSIFMMKTRVTGAESRKYKG